MKKKSYLLLISLFFGCAYLATAQTKPSQTTPAPASQPRVSKQQGNQIVYPLKNSSSPQAPQNQNQRISASPAKDTLPAPLGLNDTSELSGWLLNMAFALGIPDGDFYKHTGGDIGYGFDVTVLANLAPKMDKDEWNGRWANFYVGGGFQYLHQGGITDYYSSQNSYGYTKIESKVVNNMYALNAIARLELFPGPIKVFGEVSAGGRLFLGSHDLKIESTPYYSTSSNSTQTKDVSNPLKTDIIGNYGYGGGVKIGAGALKFELKVMYIKGSTAEYVDVHSIAFNRTNNTVTYSTQKSTTNMIIPQLGISMMF